MKISKKLLSGVCAAAFLFSASGADTSSYASSDKDVSVSYFSNAERLDDKLDFLYFQIKTENLSEKNKVISYLKDLSQIPEGQKLIMEMPRDVSILSGNSEKSGVEAMYNPDFKTITLSTHSAGKDLPCQDFVNTDSLAHEMRHAIQYAKGLGLRADSKTSVGNNFEEQFAIQKMCELDTKVRSVFIEKELLELPKYNEAYKKK